MLSCAAMPPASHSRVWAALLVVYVVWGSTYLAIRVAIETLPGFTMAGARFLLAGSILYLWAAWRGAPPPTLRHGASAAVLGALLFLCGNGGVVWAERQVASGLTAVLVGTEPLWIAALMWLPPRGHRPERRTLWGLLLGFGGVAVLAAPAGVFGGEPLHLPSVAVLVLASLAWAAGSLYGRRAELPGAPAQAAALQMLAGGAWLLAAGGLGGEWWRFAPETASTASALALAYLVLFGSVAAFSAYSWLVRTTEPTLVATYAFVNPVIAVALGWLLLDEPFGARAAAATALVVTSVVLVSSADRRGSRPAVPGRRRKPASSETAPPPTDDTPAPGAPALSNLTS